MNNTDPNEWEIGELYKKKTMQNQIYGQMSNDGNTKHQKQLFSIVDAVCRVSQPASRLVKCQVLSPLQIY